MGERRAQAYVVGVPDFARQPVDVVHVASGAAPATGEVLSDVQNARQGTLAAKTGSTLRMIAADGSVRRLRISGEGRNLDGGQDVTEDDVVVLYATPGTVAGLSGVGGYGSLAFRLADTRPAAVQATIFAVRRSLGEVPGFTGFAELPGIRARR